MHHKLVSIKFAETDSSMEMRILESYGDSPSINRCGGTRSSERSLHRCGHAGVVLFFRHKADSLAVQLKLLMDRSTVSTLKEMYLPEAIVGSTRRLMQSCSL